MQRGELQFKDFSRLEYPPAASDAAVTIPATPEGRRYWLDFIQWYCDSMTKFTGEVCQNCPAILSRVAARTSGRGRQRERNVWSGHDRAAENGPPVRRPYPLDPRRLRSFSARLRWDDQAHCHPCKVYGVPHWLEPPSAIPPDGEVSRIMEALSCGNFGFWDWGQNPVSATNVFREYSNYLTQERPLVDVALFFPTTDHRLRRNSSFPPRLAAVGQELRDVMDFDIVDEELIADEALKLYRVLVWVEGKYVEEKTLKSLAGWVKKGGVLVWWGAEVPETVEGRTDLSSALLGLAQPSRWENGGPLEIRHPSFLRHLGAHASNRADAAVGETHKRAVVLATAQRRPAIWAMPHGKGWVIAAAGIDQATFNELVRDAAYNLSRLDATKGDALEVDTDWDGVYATLLAGDEVILLNLNPEARSKIVGGTKVVFPPKSLRSVLMLRASSAGN